MIHSVSSPAGAISSPAESRSGTESRKRKVSVNSRISWIETATGTSLIGKHRLRGGPVVRRTQSHISTNFHDQTFQILFRAARAQQSASSFTAPRIGGFDVEQVRQLVVGIELNFTLWDPRRNRNNQDSRCGGEAPAGRSGNGPVRAYLHDQDQGPNRDR